ncbi:MAG TPA: hypothetical protein ENN88_03915, partial [Candidatus Coatesbacteria bacterium]|nr:hypothetical protein [Candidatus Coatesbacteria bacterium]
MSRSAQFILLLLLGPAVSALGAEEAAGEPAEVSEPEMVEPASDEAVETAEDEEAEGALPMEAVVEPPGPWRPDPVEALWRSGVIAGWGQFYNGEYLKGAILLGLEALAVYGIWYYADAAAAERRRFEAFDVPQRRTSPDLADIIARRDYHWNLYESYRVNYETHI